MCVKFTVDNQIKLEKNPAIYEGVLALKLFAPDGKSVCRPQSPTRYQSGKVYVDRNRYLIPDNGDGEESYLTGFHAWRLAEVASSEEEEVFCRLPESDRWSRIDFITAFIVMLCDIQALDDAQICGRMMLIFTHEECLRYLDRSRRKPIRLLKDRAELREVIFPPLWTVLRRSDLSGIS